MYEIPDRSVAHISTMTRSVYSKVGIAATQLAKHLGLSVIGTAGSKEGLGIVTGAGRADFAFNHNDPTYIDQIKVLF